VVAVAAGGTVSAAWATGTGRVASAGLAEAGRDWAVLDRAGVVTGSAGADIRGCAAAAGAALSPGSAAETPFCVRPVNQLLVAATACLTTCPGLVPSAFSSFVDTPSSGAEPVPSAPEAGADESSAFAPAGLPLTLAGFPLVARPLGGGAITPAPGTLSSGESSSPSSRVGGAIVRGVSGARPASPTPVLLICIGYYTCVEVIPPRYIPLHPGARFSY
jgi:hypothetical protein